MQQVPDMLDYEDFGEGGQKTCQIFQGILFQVEVTLGQLNSTHQSLQEMRMNDCLWEC